MNSGPAASHPNGNSNSNGVGDVIAGKKATVTSYIKYHLQRAMQSVDTLENEVKHCLEEEGQFQQRIEQLENEKRGLQRQLQQSTQTVKSKNNEIGTLKVLYNQVQVARQEMQKQLSFGM